MKVLLINGSPHKEGCTYTALCEVSDALNHNGVDTDVFWIGKKRCLAVLPVKAVWRKSSVSFRIRSTSFWILQEIMTALYSERRYIGALQVERLLPLWTGRFIPTFAVAATVFS